MGERDDAAPLPSSHSQKRAAVVPEVSYLCMNPRSLRKNATPLRASAQTGRRTFLRKRIVEEILLPDVSWLPFEIEGSDAMECGVLPLLSVPLLSVNEAEEGRQMLRSGCQRALKVGAYGLDVLVSRVANHT